MIKKPTLLCLTLSLLPAFAMAQTGTVGPSDGDREFTLSGTGSSDRNFDSGSFGLSGDMGWYTSDRLLLGIRQSVNYASIEGESITDDFWNGATRGFANYHFGSNALRPFVGASLGYIYGDGLNDAGFAGLETGLKYYVNDSTFLMARAEYLWFFEDAGDADDNFDDGAWQYTFGVGFNF